MTENVLSLIEKKMCIRDRANKDRVLRSEYRDKNMMRDYACFLREMCIRDSSKAVVFRKDLGIPIGRIGIFQVGMSEFIRKSAVDIGRIHFLRCV